MLAQKPDGQVAIVTVAVGEVPEIEPTIAAFQGALAAIIARKPAWLRAKIPGGAAVVCEARLRTLRRGAPLDEAWR